MHPTLVFDIETADNGAAVTEGFTVRVALNQRCSPHDTATNPTSPPTNPPASTSEIALLLKSAGATSAAAKRKYWPKPL